MSPCAVRLDTHVHLYEQYSVKRWCEAIVRNFRLGPESIGVVIVVDRAGQDSFARLRMEVPSFGTWNESLVRGQEAADSLVAEVRMNGTTFFVVRGVQYVSAEGIEVLGWGAHRNAPDGASAAELIQLVLWDGGVACLPWSPGKWLGRRGQVVSTLIHSSSTEAVVFGDISIRTRIGPPSLLLRRARRAGFTVLSGTDPLPRMGDETLVGSYGVEFSVSQRPQAEEAWGLVKSVLLNKSIMLRAWGGPSSPCKAVLRFISTF